MQTVIHINMSFFLDGGEPLCQRSHAVQIVPSALLGQISPVSRLCLSPAEIYRDWDDVGMKGWSCWIFSANHGLGGGGAQSPLSLPLGMRSGFVHDGNWLLSALREGMIGELHWVLPEWLDRENARRMLSFLEEPFLSRVSLHRWQEIQDNLPRADRIDVSFSPDICPAELLSELAGPLSHLSFDESEDYLNRIFHAQYYSRLGHLPLMPILPNVHRQPSGLVMYHGSSVQGITQLRGEPLFVSPSPGFAACFSLPIDNGAGWIQGVTYLYGEMPVPYIIAPQGCESDFEQPASLYTVIADEGCHVAGDAHGFEYATEKSLSVLGEQRFNSAYDALVHFGVAWGYHDKVRIPDGWESLIRRHADAAEEWFEMPVSALVALPELLPDIQFFFSVGLGMPLAELPAIPLTLWERFLDRMLLPSVIPYIQGGQGWHGEEHARECALFAALIAVQEGVCPVRSMVAACLHDAGRTGDDEDPGHPALSAEIACMVLDQPTFFFLDDDGRAEILDAIRFHNEPSRGVTETAAILRDADRLRLAWAEGVKDALMSTPSGLEFARGGELYARSVLTAVSAIGQAHEAGRFEGKVEITNGCNLACSFCHQDFGSNQDAIRVDMGTWRSYLDSFARSGISSLRITGGEPLTHPDLAEMLAIAKEQGFYITLNTNAYAQEGDGLDWMLADVDCLKVSLPAPDESGTSRCIGVSGGFERKLELASLAAVSGVDVEFLTPMFPDAIDAFDGFIDLLSDMSFCRWRPLRAEPSPTDLRPVSADQMRYLIERIREVRAKPQWRELMLGLAVPFCLLDTPEDAVQLLHGRSGCGPFASVVFAADKTLIRCYSRRIPLKAESGIGPTAVSNAVADVMALPKLCRMCPAMARCLGGCRCSMALTSRGFDYLADQKNAASWISQRLTDE